jgi:hypothetical protein
MKRKGMILVCSLFVLFKLSGQEFELPLETYIKTYYGTEGAFDTFVSFLPGNRMEMWTLKSDEYYRSENMSAPAKVNPVSGNYVVSTDNGINFLTVSWDNETSEKFLVLTSTDGEYLYLYKSDSEPYFYGTNHLSMGGGPVFSNNFGGNWIKASSSLTENGKTYSPANLSLRIGECWVEGVRGQGISEKLTLTISFQISEPTIFISSGFVSFLKPYLYRENSRIKKIRVSDIYGNSRIVELKDTPHFQPIDITGIGKYQAGDFEIYLEILEVYPGTKYTDTCVNSLYYHYSQ